MSASAHLEAAVRDAVAAHGRLTKDAHTLDAEASLYEAGMNSQCSVNVMLALEARFDIEFPDHLLTREVFSSIRQIANALAQCGAAQS